MIKSKKRKLIPWRERRKIEDFFQTFLFGGSRLASSFFSFLLLFFFQLKHIWNMKEKKKSDLDCVAFSPGKGKGYSLQYSDLENSMDCIVHGVAKSRTRLSDFHKQIAEVSSSAIGSK